MWMNLGSYPRILPCSLVSFHHLLSDDHYDYVNGDECRANRRDDDDDDA
jgi:hypothetical protein